MSKLKEKAPDLDEDEEEFVTEIEEERKQEESDDDQPGSPSQIWANVVPALATSLENVHRCIRETDWEASAIMDFAEAISNAIELDVVEHPGWKSLDRNPRFGKMPEDYGGEMSAEHFMARFRYIRKLGRKYYVMGRKASQGEPAKFMSFASLCPRVE